MTDLSPAWSAKVTMADGGRTFRIAGPHPANGELLSYRTAIAAAGQQDYVDLFARLAHTFGTRMPSNRQPPTFHDRVGCHRPLLTHNIAPTIRYGYGDPCVAWVEEENAWYLVATSNDAPDAFPILRSRDLVSWELTGFVFPNGEKPSWAADGPEVSDFWAPELHRVGGEWLLCFTAREHGGSLAIGLAKAASPQGPYTTASKPLLRGGVIDAHLFASGDEPPLLLWKEDSNGVWPRLLGQMLEANPDLATELFTQIEDRRTAALSAALYSWVRRCKPMEQFFLLQPLIEAVTDSFDDTRRRLADLDVPAASPILAAMQTRILAQPLSPDRAGLEGEPVVVLTNDLPWESHLIEGPWLTHLGGRFYLFYSGNDFTNHNYGIGAAVADSPFGPFRKGKQPLLRSDAAWTGPGHPSVAPGPGGRPQLFYHAYPPGELGYKAFRALLTCGLEFDADGVRAVEARAACGQRM